MLLCWGNGQSKRDPSPGQAGTAKPTRSSSCSPSSGAGGGASPRPGGSCCGRCSSVPATGRLPSSPRTWPGQVQAYGLDVHMSTIYRFLDELEELGVVSHSHLGHGPAVYDVSPVGHFHLVCELCGAVTETPDALLAALCPLLEGAVRLFHRSPPLRHGGTLQGLCGLIVRGPLAFRDLLSA